MTVLLVVAAVVATIAIAAWRQRSRRRRPSVAVPVPVPASAPAPVVAAPAERTIHVPPGAPLFPPPAMLIDAGPEDTWTSDSDSSGDYSPNYLAQRDDD